MTRTKRTILNFVTDFIPQVFIIFLGIWKIRIFLLTLGEDMLGIYQLYSQLFSYLAMVEVGLSSAVLFNLYKPVTEKNFTELKKIFNGSNYVFKTIGFIIIILGIILSFFVGFFIKNNCFDFYYLQLTFFLYVVSNVFNYFFMAKKLLFYAYEKNYIPNITFQIFMIIKSVLEIVFIRLGYGLITILVLGIVINLVVNLLIEYLFRRNFAFLPECKEKIYVFSKDLKSVSVHRFANLISSNIAIVLISKFIGLASVVIYTSYQYIALSLQLLTDKLANSILSSVGNLLNEDKNRTKMVFNDFNNILYFVALALCVPLYFTINLFIIIWYKDTIEVTYVLSVLFSILLFVNIVKQNSTLFINALGLFKETQFCSIIDIFLNLFLSLLLIKHFGISGVVSSMIISICVTELYLKNRVILCTSMGEKYFYYLKFVYPFLLMLIFNVLFIYIFFRGFVVNTFALWLIYGCLIFLVNLVLLVIEFVMCKRIYCIKSIIKNFIHIKSK